MRSAGSDLELHPIAGRRLGSDAGCGDGYECDQRPRVRVWLLFGPEVFDTIPLGQKNWQYRGGTLDVNASECDGSTLGCTPVELKPGGSISRAMHFSFRPADFGDWPGQVSVTCIFFQGKQGATWADTDHVVLTTMPFAVPVRPLDKPYKSN